MMKQRVYDLGQTFDQTKSNIVTKSIVTDGKLGLNKNPLHFNFVS